MVEKNVSSWANLKAHYQNDVQPLHLRELLQDKDRNSHLQASFESILLDYSHEKVTDKTVSLLEQLVKDSGLQGKIGQLFSGEKINKTEKRAVFHPALRAQAGEVYNVDGKNVVEDVHRVLNNIKAFSDKIRGGELKGFSGKQLRNLIVIGIGGSYLGIEFVYEAIRSSSAAIAAASGRRLKFIANVDPLDFSRAVDGLDPEETLILVNSKTFTTAETMLNAKTCKTWLLNHYRAKGQELNTKEQINAVTQQHLCACSTNLPATRDFGITDEKVFEFWDWVGGRFSVCSAIGILPLSIHFGFGIMQSFLDGAHSIDQHFVKTTEVRKNLPLLLGLLGFYHNTIQGYSARALLPYCQALCKFAPHIQQVDMESNGKRVSVDGEVLTYETGAVNFGEPGTNGQHSFYQLLHQGRAIPCEFIGFCKSQTPILLSGETVSNHDELMSNFFSQPDALACGKNLDDLKKENVPENLQQHKFFTGDRPSLSFLITELSAYTTGQLLAIYEHRTAVEGFLWSINSFDQFGVELGKALAKNVRTFLEKNSKNESADFAGTNFNSSTQSQLAVYLANKDKH